MVFYVFAYITGSIIVALSLLNFIFPARKTTLIIKLAFDIVTVINGVFILLATENTLIIASIGTSVVGIARDIIYSLREKHKAFDCWAWPIGFATLFGLSLIFTYRGWQSILPVVGSVVSAITLYFYNQKVTKSGAIFCASMYIAYNALLLVSSDVLTVFALASYIASFIGATIGLFIICFKKSPKSV